jgi:WXG100 family type VII secretion target
MQDRVEIDYEQMQTVEKEFGERADQVDSLYGIIQGAVDDLRNGGWKGEHADQFYAEMDQRIMPALKNLQIALMTAKDITDQISEEFSRAEEEAKSLFPASFF